MDAVSLTSCISPDMLQNVGDMLQLAVASCNIPPKALAAEVGYSVDSLYAAMNNARSIPVKARQKLSSVNVIAAAAVALESTGFKRLFGYQKVDRHVQSMIIRVQKHDKEVAVLLSDLPVLLLDKNSHEDLSKEDVAHVTLVAERLVDRVNCTINLLMELEVKYRLGLTPYLQAKENRLSGHSSGFSKN